MWFITLLFTQGWPLADSITISYLDNVCRTAVEAYSRRFRRSTTSSGSLWFDGWTYSTFPWPLQWLKNWFRPFSFWGVRRLYKATNLYLNREHVKKSFSKVFTKLSEKYLLTRRWIKVNSSNPYCLNCINGKSGCSIEIKSSHPLHNMKHGKNN